MLAKRIIPCLDVRDGFHYLAVADVKAGDYPFCQHWIASVTLNLPSSSARPRYLPRWHSRGFQRLTV
jgi:hypothetical protein